MALFIATIFKDKKALFGVRKSTQIKSRKYTTARLYTDNHNSGQLMTRYHSCPEFRHTCCETATGHQRPRPQQNTSVHPASGSRFRCSDSYCRKTAKHPDVKRAYALNFTPQLSLNFQLPHEGTNAPSKPP